jgi:hypothetical protein
MPSKSSIFSSRATCPSSEYYGRLKRLADTLYDCGATVSDSVLIINTLRGLNNKFSQAIAVLSTMTPPPMFLY